MTDSSDALAGVPATSYLSPRVCQYADHAKAANTWRAYRIDWDDFVGWCGLQRCAPLPAAHETVAEYLVSLADAETLRPGSEDPLLCFARVVTSKSHPM